MDAFRFIWDFLFGTIIRSYNFFDSWFQNASEHGFKMSTGSMIISSFISLIFCGSALTAMTFAELKNRNRWLHCAIGFFVPIVYPAILYFVIPKIGESHSEEEEEEEEEVHEKSEEVPESDLKAYADGKGDGTGIMPAHGILNQDYFSKRGKDERGNFIGPFILELEDGQILEIEYIVEAFPQAVAVQLGQGDEGRTIRLPYSKIKDCKTKRRWLEEAEQEDVTGEESFEDEGEE